MRRKFFPHPEERRSRVSKDAGPEANLDEIPVASRFETHRCAMLFTARVTGRIVDVTEKNIKT
jgi:hypothetical protein